MLLRLLIIGICITLVSCEEKSYTVRFQDSDQPPFSVPLQEQLTEKEQREEQLLAKWKEIKPDIKEGLQSKSLTEWFPHKSYSKMLSKTPSFDKKPIYLGVSDNNIIGEVILVNSPEGRVEHYVKAYILLPLKTGQKKSKVIILAGTWIME